MKALKRLLSRNAKTRLESADFLLKLDGVTERECNICGYRGLFAAYGRPPRFDAVCGNCGSFERHRLFVLMLERTGLLTGRCDLLHFAPEAALGSYLRERVHRYVPADLNSRKADLCEDIERLSLADESHDVVVANHVLEHVDDRKALSEIHRVLRPNGLLIATVPIVEGWDETYEDGNIATADSRLLHFGQHDHVRMYGADFRDRLIEAGFELSEFVAQGQDCVTYGLVRGSRVFIASKTPLALPELVPRANRPKADVAAQQFETKPQADAEISEEELNGGLEAITESIKQTDKIIAHLKSRQTGASSDDSAHKQLDTILSHTTRIQSIVEHWDRLLAQFSVFKPVIMAPAKLVGWLRGGPKRKARPRSPLLPFATDNRHKATILFMPINGVGLGHLSRCLAIAKGVKRLAPESNIIFLSNSPALHLIHRQGFTAYGLLPHSQETYVSKDAWNQLLSQRLEEIDRLHRPSTLVFDGTWPYKGLVQHLKRNQDLRGVWIHHFYRDRAGNERALARQGYFSHMIEIAELGLDRAQARQLTVDYSWINPAVNLMPEEIPSRLEARAELNLPADARAVLISLGAGVINDIFGDLQTLLGVIGELPNVYTVIAESPIGKRIISHQPRTMVLRDFPLCRYCNAFDAAIIATGGNTIYEMLCHGVPTLQIPNQAAVMDEQLTRAREAEKAGAGICLEKPDQESVRAALRTLLDPEKAAGMREAAKATIRCDGAEQAARVILDIQGHGETSRKQPEDTSQSLGKTPGHKAKVRSTRQSRKRPRLFGSGASEQAGTLRGSAFGLGHEKQRTIFLVATNGVGLGHLTRSLAVARRIQRLSPDTKLVMLTTSPALHLVFQQGIVPHFMPPLALENRDDKRDWSRRLRSVLQDILDRYRPDTLVFDGAFPYHGLRETILANSNLYTVWMPLPFNKPPSTWPGVRGNGLFDLTLHSGEIEGVRRNYQIDPSCEIIAKDPVTFLDRSEALERGQARRELGLAKDGKLILVSLGAANPQINQYIEELETIVGAMPSTGLVIAESIIGERFSRLESGTQVIREFPVSRFFNAFDAAVAAAGVNTVYELLVMGLPTVLIPSPRDTMEQSARARAAERLGAALYLQDPDHEALSRAIQRVMDSEEAARMRQAGLAAVGDNGAEHAARIILGLEE